MLKGPSSWSWKVLEAVRKEGVSRGNILTTSFNMQVPSVRQKVRTQLERDRPDVLIASPPNSAMGVWNRDNWTGDESLSCFGISRASVCKINWREAALYSLNTPGPYGHGRFHPPNSCANRECVPGVTRVCRMNERPMKEMTGWLTNSDELGRALMQLRPRKHGEELMDDILSAVGLERNQEMSTGRNK